MTLLPATALVAGLLAPTTTAHGGTYPGPGDTITPGNPGGDPGGSNPNPSTPTGGGTPTPGVPSPGSGSPSPGQPAPTPGKPVSPTGGDMGPDFTHWSFWWDLNKWGFLELREQVHSGLAVTGDDDFGLGIGQIFDTNRSYRPTEIQIEQEIVPALLGALRTETHNDIVTGAMLALAKIGDVRAEDGRSPFAEEFAPFLADANQEIAETAAIALGVLGHESVVPLLAGLLRNDEVGIEAVGGTEVSFRTRAFAAYGLSLLSRSSADMDLRAEVVGLLARELVSDRSAHEDLKVACVISLGLVPLAASGEVPTDEVTTPTTLEEQIAFLQAFLDEDESRLARAHAPTSLARLVGSRDSAAKDAVVRDLLERVDEHSKEPNEVLRGSTVALGLLGDRDGDDTDADVREALFDLQKRHSDLMVRNLSLIALGEVGGRRGVGEIDALDEVVEHLQDTLAGNRNATRPWAALGLGVLGHRLAENREDPPLGFRGPVRASLGDTKNPVELGAYAVAAGLMADVEATGTLREHFDRVKDTEVRGLMAVALGMLRATGEQDAIREVCTDSEYRPGLLKRSAIGLGLMGDKEIVKDLLTMLADSGSLSSQAALCSALGFIGDTRSVDALIGVMQDTSVTATARGFAAVALGLVAEKEAYPWNFAIGEHLNYLSAPETLNDMSGAGNGIVNIL